MLRELGGLAEFAQQLERGEEPVLRVVLGDLCPREPILGLLSKFFAQHGRTRLHLDYEAVGGPAERLREGTADLIVHRLDETDASLESLKGRAIRLIPLPPLH